MCISAILLIVVYFVVIGRWKLIFGEFQMHTAYFTCMYKTHGYIDVEVNSLCVYQTHAYKSLHDTI